MCGLFGVVRTSGITDSDRVHFEGLAANLIHRGPDGTGLIEDRGLLLGMHRLSIMDVDHGWQPFWSEDGSIGILGNGEIYNAASLGAQLADRGHRLLTRSDMEVIPHLYEEYGIDFVQHLRGMFALVILDKRRGRLLLVRDRMGEKPLCYAFTDGAFTFASEQSALVRAGIVPFALEPSVLPQYLLYGFTPEPFSLVTGISKVPAGSIAELDLATGSLDVRAYWSMLEHLGDEPLTTDRLRRTIEDAVEACCQSDMPVGIALSGGLDSSMVAVIANRVRSDLTAFSIGYNGGPSDESSMAAELASGLGIPHVVSHLDAREVGASFAEVCAARDEPVSDIAGPSLSAVSKSAHDAGVPVLMTGMGGDELFWGYEWSRRLASYAFARLSPTGSPAASYSLRQWLPQRSPAGLAQWLETAGGLKVERDLDTYFTRWSSDQTVPIALFEFQNGYPGVVRDVARLCRVESGFPHPRKSMPRSAHLVPGYYINALCETYLRVNGLVQLDRLSMHHSVESRTPLVDYQLTEVVLSSTMHGDDGLSGPPKAKLRQVAKELLPAHVINRPKLGFTPPVRDWVAEIWRNNGAALSTDSLLAESGLLEGSRVLANLRRPLHRTGRVNQIALRLATLELWARAF